MEIREYLETKLAPRIQGDGGWVEYVSEEGDQLTLIFRGECSKCHMLDRCTAWMESRILEDTGRTLHIRSLRRKPFFWDNN